MLAFKWALPLLSRMPAAFYAVANGRKPGVYRTWDECKAQVHQFSKPIYKKFSTYSEAEDFIKQKTGTLGTINKEQSSSFSSSVSLQLPRKVYALGKSKKAFSEVDTEASSPLPPSKKQKLNEGSETKDGFSVDTDGYVTVYTDGACQNNGQKGARAGIGVWFGDHHPMNVSKALEGVATNNKAEINAVITAVNQAKQAGVKKLKIHTDSQFLISCVTKWMPKWKRNGWKTTTGNVKNKVELLELEKALSGIDIAWNHVNGHVGIHGNEMADKLARDGCAFYKPPK